MAGRKWTDEEEATLTRLYANTSNAELVKMLGRSYSSVAGHADIMGLKKSEEYMASNASGRLIKGDGRGGATRFKSGHQSFNKGRKQKEYMTNEAIERTAATRFKSGGLPHNTKHDGAISERSDKSGKKYLYIRVAKAKWVLYQRYLWEQEHGAIPEGMLVAFKDGNSLNCVLDNLELRSRRQNMDRNTYHQYPKEIADTIQMLGALTRQINKRA